MLELLFALNLVTLLMQIQFYRIILPQCVVVICFKFSNFAYANTVLTKSVTLAEQLLFALNLVTLLMQIQYIFKFMKILFVVICFKFSNFAYANTVKHVIIEVRGELLFALNLVTLLMQIQYDAKFLPSSTVVICFKFSNFAYANTVI